MSKGTESAIRPAREEDYPQWYQQVIKSGELAENSSVRGCMVIKPWGYGLWEGVHRHLDRMIKETGHENAYFPLFIPLSYLEKEAEHVEGFAKECAVVTHHRLEEKDGKLIPAGELEEPLIVRPTSETIIGESFSKWVQSYRDLPLLINQWANVVRWEMRTRLFLRTAEFLWQEGHTVHATAEDALEEVDRMLEVYRTLAEDVLCIPVITGEKTPGERFPGAVRTLTIEAMMQDRKALQSGTSHFLGQNFAKASNIKFLDQAGELQFGYTTSWGLSTRIIGGIIMTHGDDDGLRIPPRVAPQQVVVLPVIPKEEAQGIVMDYASEVEQVLKSLAYADEPVRATVDRRDLRGGEKNWQWIKKGIPIRIEVGPRDVENRKVVLCRRDRGHKEKEFLSLEELSHRVPEILAEIHATYSAQAREYRDANIQRDIQSYDEFQEFFTPKNAEKPEIHGGFVLAKWCGDEQEEERLKELKISIRCLPLEQSGTTGKCVVTGREASTDAIFAKSY